MTKKKKVGEASIELSQKAPETRDPIELQREMMKDYCDNVIQCALEGKKLYDGIFYVVVITKKERLMHNVVRSYYFHRKTCPTPDWDQAVYQFNPEAESFSMLWVIPAKDIADMLYFNAAVVADDEKQLRNYVLEFYNGDLLREAKKLNGERADSIILEV